MRRLSISPAMHRNLDLVSATSTKRMISSLHRKRSISPLPLHASPLPCVILVSPFLDMNVGAVARTMLNFGFQELRVVSPECDIHSVDAMRVAAGAAEILENATLFDSLESSLSDLSTVMATTAKPRDIHNMEVVSPEAAAREMITCDEAMIAEGESASIGKGQLSGGTSGIVFGRERSGLTNDEIACTQKVIIIPTSECYTALNLGQAVNIVCYEMWKQRIQLDCALQNATNDVTLDAAHHSPHENTDNSLQPSTMGEIHLFVARLHDLLRGSEGHGNGSGGAGAGAVQSNCAGGEAETSSGAIPVQSEGSIQRRESLLKIVQMVLQRASLTKRELQAFHGMITYLSKKSTL